MLAFLGMLAGPMAEAGIRVPPDFAEKMDFYEIYLPNLREEYPHLFVYAIAQLGAALPSPTSHWTNAKIIASIPDDKIRSITMGELLDMGWEIIYGDAGI